MQQSPFPAVAAHAGVIHQYQTNSDYYDIAEIKQKLNKKRKGNKNNEGSMGKK